MLDVVLVPGRELASATDVSGVVAFRQGGSAANTARWLGRLDVAVELVCAVGRDAVGRALVAALRADRVRVRATRVAGERTGRIGVVVAPGGERSFVADRGAADRLAPGDLDPDRFRVDHLHLPAYSLVGEPLGAAGRRAIELARAAGASVSLDLASSGPLLAAGRAAALDLVRDAAPDLLFATEAEAEALLGSRAVAPLGELAPLVVVKRGARGATVLARGAGPGPASFDVATRHLHPSDTTGAGDAFDAGFLAAWLAVPAAERSRPAALHRAVLAGHRVAARQLTATPRELPLG